MRCDQRLFARRDSWGTLIFSYVVSFCHSSYTWALYYSSSIASSQTLTFRWHEPTRARGYVNSWHGSRVFRKHISKSAYTAISMISCKRAISISHHLPRKGRRSPRNVAEGLHPQALFQGLFSVKHRIAILIY